MVFTGTIMLHASKYLLLLVLCLFGLITHANECLQPVNLTFDVGNMRNAEEIAATLRAKKIQATFFLANNPTIKQSGALTEPWRNYWLARVREGHQFGNHTWSHHYIRKDISSKTTHGYTLSGQPFKLDESGFCDELKKVENAFFKLTGKSIQKVWRAPAGRTSANTIKWAKSCGYEKHIGWSKAGYIRDDLSSDTYPNQALLDNASKNIQSGDTVIMHLGVWKRKIAAADILPRLIDNLRQRGLCFKSLTPSNI